jgi:protein arginine kinase
MSEAFNEVSEQEPTWLDGVGPQADCVVSSRVRLARNLRGHRFSHHASGSELTEIRHLLATRILERPSFAGGWSLELEQCTLLQRKFLLERHLASPDLVREFQHRGLLLSADLGRVVMVNEEDHLRLQVFHSGFNPTLACQDALALDAELEEVLDFAFSDDLGYLTTCPTNVGTGFRLSVLVHLPGLILSKEIERILNSLRQLQFTVRGLYGEGSAVRGALFQISNLGTLGRSEETLTSDFYRHVGKVIHYESLARERLLEEDRLGLEDTVHRSLAVLHEARLLTSQEAFDRLSHVRMGISLGLLPGPGVGILNRALLEMQNAHLQVRATRPLEGRERSAARAELLRRLLA